jgi:hypothetical protein
MKRTGFIVSVRSYQSGHSAAARSICRDSGMNSCLADETVTTVDWHKLGVVRFRTPNHQPLILKRLVANSMWSVQLDSATISWAAEGQMGGRKWTTAVSVQATAIARIPQICSAPKIFRLAIAFDVARGGVMPQHQRPCQEPASIQHKEK